MISTGYWLLALRLCTALGTIIGASMVAMAFALGLTMLLTLIKLDMVRKGGLLVTPLAVQPSSALYCYQWRMGSAGKAVGPSRLLAV